jgi:pimeloyl-ACP methyl ester carboxylesterase
MPLVFTPAFMEREKEYLKSMLQRTMSYGFATEGLAGQVAAAMGHDTVTRLGMIDAPTLVVTGTKDRLVPPVLSRVLAAGIPGSKLVEIPGGVHGLPIEHAEELNGILVPWLEGHD